MALLVRLPGQPAAILEKRAGDSRHYELDCQLLLREYELLVAVMSVQGEAVDLSLSKIGANNILKLYLNSAAYSANTVFIDTPISAICKTSQGTIQASVLLRVYQY